MPFYENQEGSIRDLVERESYWNIESIESPDSIEKDVDQQTPKTSIEPDVFSINQQQQQTSSSPSSSQSPTALNLVSATSPIKACYAPKNANCK